MAAKKRDKTIELKKNGTPDPVAARKLLDGLLNKAPHTVLRACGSTAKLYAVALDAIEANQLLETCNWRNRVVRQNKVKQHAKRMTAGKWRLQNPILFSDEGEMLDGQHRLLATKEACVTVPFMVQLIEKGVVDEAHLAIDAGVPRNLVDYLHFHGVPNANRATPLLVLERNARISRSPFQEARGEKEDYLRLYRSLPAELLEQVYKAVPRGFHLNLGLKRAVVDWVALQLVQISAEDAEVFFGLMADPSSLSSKDAPYVASRRFLEQAARSARTGGKTPPIEQGVILVKAWNAYYENRHVSEFQYRAREDFPAVSGMR